MHVVEYFIEVINTIIFLNSSKAWFPGIVKSDFTLQEKLSEYFILLCNAQRTWSLMGPLVAGLDS